MIPTTARVGGVMVSIDAFQALDPGSIPGHRILFRFSWFKFYDPSLKFLFLVAEQNTLHTALPADKLFPRIKSVFNWVQYSVFSWAYQAGENKLNENRCSEKREIIRVNCSVSVLLPQVRDDKKQAGDKCGKDDNIIDRCQQIAREDWITTLENGFDLGWKIQTLTDCTTFPSINSEVCVSKSAICRRQKSLTFSNTWSKTFSNGKFP